MKGKFTRWMTVWVGMILSVQAVYAQRVFTLEDCRALALENNAEIKNAALSFENARDTRRAVMTKYFPQISATAGYFATNDDVLSLQMIPGYGFTFLGEGFVGGITAVQPVFAGGQIMLGNRLAKIGVDVGKYQLEAKTRDVSTNVEHHFWMYVSLREKVAVIAAADSLISNLYKDVSNLVEAGVCSKSDLLEVKYAQNDILSRKIELNDGIFLSKMALAQYIGVQVDSFDIVSLPLPQLQNPESLRIDPYAALSLLPEYKMLNKNVDAKELMKNMQVGSYLPKFMIGAGYQTYNMLGSDHSFGSIFGIISIPITSWWEGAYNIRKAKREIRMAQNDLENLQELLILRMRKVENEMVMQFERLKLAEEGLEIAREKYEVDRQYYDAGMLALSQLLETQTKMVQSENNLIDTEIGYLLKCREYLDVTGREFLSPSSSGK